MLPITKMYYQYDSLDLTKQFPHAVHKAIGDLENYTAQAVIADSFEVNTVETSTFGFVVPHQLHKDSYENWLVTTFQQRGQFLGAHARLELGGFTYHAAFITDPIYLDDRGVTTMEILELLNSMFFEPD